MAYLALTLKRPWPYAIFKYGKDIENRVWVPAPDRLRQRDDFYIHAGSNWDQQGAEWIDYHFGSVPPKAEHPTGIIGRVKYDGWASAHPSEWFNGPKGWLLTDRLEFKEPVPCGGALNLWPIPKFLHSVIVDAEGQALKTEEATE